MTHEHIINEFGRRAGLPSLTLERDKPARLNIEGMGSLFIEETEEDILLYMARTFPSHDRDAPRRALALCRSGLARPFPIYAALRQSGTLIFLTRFNKKSFSLQSLEQAIPILSRSLDESLSA
jgi:type III secretion system chaperone SycN